MRKGVGEIDNSGLVSDTDQRTLNTGHGNTMVAQDRATVLVFPARLPDLGHKLSCSLLEHLIAALGDVLSVDQFAADGNRRRAGLQEFRSSHQTDSASRNHLDLRERSLKRPNVLRSADRIAWENLDHIGARLP